MTRPEQIPAPDTRRDTETTGGDRDSGWDFRISRSVVVVHSWWWVISGTETERAGCKCHPTRIHHLTVSPQFALTDRRCHRTARTRQHRHRMSRGSGSNCDLCLEYARSGRAKCRGGQRFSPGWQVLSTATCSRFCVACNLPDTHCTGTCWGTIEKGALRLGKTPRDIDYSDWVSTSWIHW